MHYVSHLVPFDNYFRALFVALVLALACLVTVLCRRHDFDEHAGEFHAAHVHVHVNLWSANTDYGTVVRVRDEEMGGDV
jgi:hypothetical protein